MAEQSSNLTRSFMFDLEQYTNNALAHLLEIPPHPYPKSGPNAIAAHEDSHSVESMFSFPDLLNQDTSFPSLDADLEVLNDIITSDMDTNSLGPSRVIPNHDLTGEEDGGFLESDSPWSSPPNDQDRRNNRTFSKSSDEGLSLSPMSSGSDSHGSPTLGATPDIGDLPSEIMLSLSQHNQDRKQETQRALEAEAKRLPQTSGPSSNNCHVCLEKAGKHNYYGGRVCPSCRAFFRRAVQSKYYEIFFCTKGEQCEINLKTRRSCQFCRFKKCLDSGMRVAWVLPDGERNRRFNKLQKSSQRNPAFLDSEKAIQEVAPKPFGITGILPQDIEAIHQVHNKIDAQGAQSMKEFILADPIFMKDLCSYSYFGGKINFNFQLNFQKMCNKFIHYTLTTMEDFRLLPLNDRRLIIEVNGDLLNRFKYSVSIQETDCCLSNGIEWITKSGEFPFLTEITEKLSELKMSDRKPVLAYNQFFSSPWAPTEAKERRFFDLVLKMKAWPRDDASSPVDEVQMTLCKMVIAFTPDFLSLERRDLVEKTQTKFAMMLHTYLRFRYGERKASKRFAEGLMMSTYAREAQAIFETRLPV